MKRLLSYSNYNTFNHLDSRTINEGVKYSCTHDENGKLITGNIDIDWNQDYPEDVIKLNPVKPVKSSRLSTIETHVGYALEDPRIQGDAPNHRVKKCFSEFSKNWGSISDEDLKNLIDYSYPNKLRESNVKVLFVVGSSAPISARIADALKELYYRKAKIVDITKAYYGADITDIVDQDKYKNADERTRQMIDTYTRSFQTTYDQENRPVPPRNKWEGYIKKSSGLQSGARSLLKPGHVVDNYILDIIRNEMEGHQRTVQTGDMRIARLNKPAFLAVDDLIIAGSTMRNSLSMILNAISSRSANIPMSNLIATSTFGYVLFSYGDRF